MSVEDSIAAAKQAVEMRGRALRTLVEGAEIGRRHRSVQVPIQWVKSTTNALRGVVTGSRGAYSVGVTLRSGSVRSTSCDCQDHGRAGVCKHVVAVSNYWIENTGRPVWAALRDALDALQQKETA